MRTLAEAKQPECVVVKRKYSTTEGLSKYSLEIERIFSTHDATWIKLYTIKLD